MDAIQLVKRHIADLRAPMRGVTGQVVDDRRERLADALATVLAATEVPREVRVTLGMGMCITPTTSTMYRVCRAWLASLPPNKPHDTPFDGEDGG